MQQFPLDVIRFEAVGKVRIDIEKGGKFSIRSKVAKERRYNSLSQARGIA